MPPMLDLLGHDAYGVSSPSRTARDSARPRAHARPRPAVRTLSVRLARTPRRMRSGPGHGCSRGGMERPVPAREPVLHARSNPRRVALRRTAAARSQHRSARLTARPTASSFGACSVASTTDLHQQPAATPDPGRRRARAAVGHDADDRRDDRPVSRDAHARMGRPTNVGQLSARDSEHNDAVVLAEVLRRGLPNARNRSSSGWSPGTGR